MVKRTSRYVVAAAAVVAVFYMFETQMTAPVLPIYSAKELGALPFMVGIVMGVYSITNCFGNIVFGRMSDLWGRRLPLTVGFLGTGLLVLAYSLATSPVHLVVIRLIQGFFSGALGPCTSAILTDLAPPGRRGAYMGVWGMSVAIGVTISSALAGILSTSFGYFSVWLTIASGCTLAVIILWAFVPETHPRQQVQLETSTVKTQKPDFISILKRKNVLFACLGILSQYWLLGTIVVLFSLYLADLKTAGIIKPDPKMALAMLLASFGLASVMLNYLFGRLADTVGRKWPLTAAFFLLTAAPLLVSNPSVPLIVFAWIIAWSLAATITWPTLLALLTDELAPHERGAGLGVFMVALTIGTGIGMPVMGAAGNAIGLDSAIKLAAILPAITFILSWFIQPKPVAGGKFGTRLMIIMAAFFVILIALSYPLIRFLQP